MLNVLDLHQYSFLTFFLVIVLGALCAESADSAWDPVRRGGRALWNGLCGESTGGGPGRLVVPDGWSTPTVLKLDRHSDVSGESWDQSSAQWGVRRLRRTHLRHLSPPLYAWRGQQYCKSLCGSVSIKWRRLHETEVHGMIFDWSLVHLSGWLIDCLMDWLIDCSMHWLIDCLIVLVGRLIDWLTKGVCLNCFSVSLGRWAPNSNREIYLRVHENNP